MATDTKELRGDAPLELVTALDALALSLDVSRTVYVNQVLERHVRLELHRHSLLSNMLRGNPMLAEADRRHKS